MNSKALKWIDRLKLESHPEGGYFKEIYRSTQEIPKDALSPKREDPRQSATSIYFLLAEHQVSQWHRLKSDEIWYYHAGSPILIHTITPSGNYSISRLGTDFEKGELPQVILDAETIFGAELEDKSSFGLVSCMVSPGFDFRDFEMLTYDTLQELFPLIKEEIPKLGQK